MSANLQQSTEQGSPFATSLDVVLQRRRESWRFRLANMLVLAAFFQNYGPPGVMSLIGGVYLLHQLFEVQGLRRVPRQWIGYEALALATLASASLLFGLPALVWGLTVGMPGLLSGGFLLAGAALNSLLGAKGCRRSLMASTLPFLGYLVLALAMVVYPRFGAMGLVRVGIASTAMCLAGLKLWADASRTYVAERRALRQTAHKQADLEIALEAARAADLAKGEFLANMSHEIRTPLNGILATAQILQLRSHDAEERRLLQLVQRSGRDLQRILNDVLDLSKIVAGQLEIEAIAFDPIDELESLVASYTPAAHEKGLHLRLDLLAGTQGRRMGDPVRLRQIVGNLLSNALKFTSQGGVDLVVRDLCDGDESLEITVADTGLGIAPDKLKKLFERFSQLDGSTTRRFGGTGLGLAISRQLAELMNGVIDVDSQEGVGSRFRLVLRMPRVVEADAPAVISDRNGEPTGTPPDRPLHVLAADDNETNRLVLSTILDMFGFVSTLVANGVEAVEAWRCGDFDVILMDVQMPELDGVAATAEIRRLEAVSRRPRTPILAVSANAFADQVARYFQAGMDGHVAKPIEIAQLHAAISMVCSDADEPSEPPMEQASAV